MADINSLMKLIGNNVTTDPRQMGTNIREGAGKMVKSAEEMTLAPIHVIKNLLALPQVQEFIGGLTNKPAEATQEPQLSPQQQIAKDAMDSNFKNTVKESWQQGVTAGADPFAMLHDGYQHYGIPGGQVDQLANSQQSTPQIDTSKPQVNPQQAQGILSRMLGGFAQGFQSGAAPNLAQQQLTQAQTAATQQKMAGLEPLQAGEREKLNIEATNKIFENMSTVSKGADATTQQKINIGKTILTDLDGIEQQYHDVLGKGGGAVWGTLVKGAQLVGQEQKISNYDDLVNAYSTKLGKYIGEDRFTDQDRKVFRKLFPNSFTQPKQVSTKFAMIKSIIASQLNAQQSGSKASFSATALDLMRKADEARKLGYSEDDIRNKILGGI